MKQFEKIIGYPPELIGRLNSFIVTEFDDSMTVEMQLRVLIKWILKNIDLTNAMVDYLNEFIKNFDANLYKTVADILNKWTEDGTMSDLINETLFKDIWFKINTLEKEKADITYVDGEIKKLANGGIKGFYQTLGELKAAYPNGAEGFYYVVEDGYIYAWKNNAWVQVDKYMKTIIDPDSLTYDKFVGKNKLFSLLPTDEKLWHTMKVNTVIGSGLQYNATIRNLETDSDYYTKSVDSYGLYTTLLPIRPNVTLHLRGTNNYRVSLCEFDSSKKIINVTQWANTIDVVTQNSTRYVLYAIKRYDEKGMSITELPLIDCGVYSETEQRSYTELPKTIFNEPYDRDWIQGIYNTGGQGEQLSGWSYSNYRQSKFYEVAPSVYYKLSINLNNLYSYVVFLLDRDKKLLSNSGWVTTRNEVTIRTTPDTYYMILMVKNRNDSSQFKDAQRLDANPKLSLMYPAIHYQDQTLKVAKDLIDRSLLKDKANWRGATADWLRQSIGRGSDGKVNTPHVTNRLLTRVFVKKGVYLIKNLTDPMYQFNYVTVKENGDYVGETYWQCGSSRLKIDNDGYIYISVYKKVDGVSVDFDETDVKYFSISIEETTYDSPLLDFKYSKRKIICHRGASLIEPENTIPAWLKCGELGVWGAEMDVQFSKDNVPVIMHDETIDRTTTGTGKVSELTLEQLKEVTIDFGQNIEKYKDLKIPTLHEGITACKMSGTTPVLDIGSLSEKPDKVKLLMSFLKENALLESVILLTQGTWLASYIRSINTITPIIAQFNGVIGADLESRRLFRYPNAYCGGWNLTATDEQLRELFKTGHDYNLIFYVITNDKEEAKKLFSLGMDFISSDDPYILDDLIVDYEK